MHNHGLFILALAGLAAVGANAATHVITVGEGQMLRFSPNTLTADVGDM